jgi:Ca2+-binding RTX toxin-like protein
MYGLEELLASINWALQQRGKIGQVEILGAADDTVFGTDGNDLMFGNGGHDELHGGDGNDLMFGHAGQDDFWLGAGNDTVYGGDDQDIILAGDDSDRVYGGNGDDIFSGENGTDMLYGDAGNDEIWGGADKDVIYGGTGDDRLEGDGGNDTIYGGSGADRIIADTLDGDDVVADFAVTADELVFRGVFSSVADALSHATQSGSAVLFDTGNGDSVRVLNTLLAQFNDGNLTII